MRFEFATAQKIVFGAGIIKEVGPLARDLGKRPLVVTGAATPRAEPLIVLLNEQGLAPSVFSSSGEPELSTVERGVAQAKGVGCDFVISFGGGSAIDAGKAIAAMLTNGGELLDYLEVIGKGKTLSQPAAPFIAIPTTAGTGSEVTRNAVLASSAHRVKVSLRSPFMLARVALVDPELTYDLPPSLTASTGLDALTQLIEPYVSSRANPMTDALCLEGMRLCARSLRTAFENGRSTASREDMSVASLFGGLALANAGLGAVHGFAGPIGGMFSAPHGGVCAALLPHVMDINLRALRQRSPAHQALVRYEQAARVLTGKPSSAADEGVVWVRELVAALKVPGLAAHDITPANIPALVEQATRASSMKANPIALTSEEMAEALQRAL